MNTGQMLITIGAIFLLSMVILTTNRGLITTNATMVDNRYGILGVSLATSTIEKATSRAFDNNTDTLSIDALSSLTNVNQLGLEAGESSNNPDGFNDIDDYNCYKVTPRVDSLSFEGTNRKIAFNTYCNVDYVSVNDPRTVLNQRSWHKRITVRVISPGMTDTIKMSSVYSYWYFR
ncbi:MAG: hypothetical protein HYS25_05630 [Ignavibacteriales bacterium]|nr:hypothetical protein [Ignavibacteriales bacterium]